MNKTVLIVDDSSMMRKLIIKLLEPAGYEIIGEASGGIESVEKYKELNPWLVTMDITMRDMDGITAAREIKTFDENANILFMSNLDNDKYRTEVEQVSELGIVSKHDTQMILNAIKEIE